MSTWSKPSFSAERRAQLLGAILLAALLFGLLASPPALGSSPGGGSTVTIISDPVKSIPATIKLEYSGNVTIKNGTLRDATGTMVAFFDANNFSAFPAGQQKNFTINITQQLTSGTAYTLKVQRGDPLQPALPPVDDYIRFTYSPDHLSLNLLNLHQLKTTPQVQSPTGSLVRKSGFAQNAPYIAEFSTSKPAWCRYSTNGQPDAALMAPMVGGTASAPATHHNITDLSGNEISQLVISCNTTIECPNNKPSCVVTWSDLVLGYEAANPDFTYTLDPVEITDPEKKETNLSFSLSGQKIFCNATMNGETFTTVSSYGIDASYSGAYLYDPWLLIQLPTTPDEETHNFIVTCANRAGRTNTTTVPVKVNLTYPPLLVRITPGPFTNTTDPLLTVRVEKKNPVSSSECRFLAARNGGVTANQPLMKNSDNIHYTKQLSALPEGNHNYSISCTIAGGVQVAGNVNFTVDTTKPEGYALTAPKKVCGDAALNATVTLKQGFTPEQNLLGFAYNVTKKNAGPNPVNSALSVDGNLSAPNADEEGATYTWTVLAVDEAENSVPVDQNGAESTRLPLTHASCDVTPPSITIITKLEGDHVRFWPNCTDTGVGCSPTYTYDFVETDVACTYASTEQYRDSNGERWLRLFQSKKVCINATDTQGNARLFEETISLPDFHPSVNYTAPRPFTNTNPVGVIANVLLGTTPIEATSCFFQQPPGHEPFTGTLIPSADKKTFTSSILASDNGYNLFVNCTLPGGKSVRDKHSFTLDTKAPRGYSLEGLREACLPRGLRISIVHDPRVETESVLFNYTITHNGPNGPYTLHQEETTETHLSYVPAIDAPPEKRLYVDETYRWSLLVTDRAGNTQSVPSTPLTFDQRVVLSGAVCDTTPPTGSVTFLPVIGGTHVNLSCSDDEGCADSFDYSVHPAGTTTCALDKKGSLAGQHQLEELLFYAPGTFCYRVYDLAGNNASGSNAVTIGAGKPTLRILQPVAGSVTNNKTFRVQAERNGAPLPSDQCRFLDAGVGTFVSTDGRLFTAQANVPSNPLGTVTVDVACKVRNGGWLEKNVTFTFDESKPNNFVMEAPPKLCLGQGLRVTVGHNDRYGSPDANMAGYRYEVLYAETGVTVPGSPNTFPERAGTITYEGSLQAGTSYTWRIVAYDAAGNEAPVTGPSTTQVLPPTDPSCDVTPPGVELSLVPVPLGVTVQVRCTDENSGCADAFSYDLLPPGTSVCTYVQRRDKSGGSPPNATYEVSTLRDATLCYKVSDKMLNSVTGTTPITINGPPAALHFLAPSGPLVANTTFRVGVRRGQTPVASTRCRFLSLPDSFVSGDNGLTYVAQPSLPDGGPYTIGAECEVLATWLNDSITFSLDTKAPDHHLLVAPERACVDQGLRAKASHDHRWLLDPGFDGYFWELGYPTGNAVVASGTTGHEGTLHYASPVAGETYQWRVWGVDKAGNKGVLQGSPTNTEALPKESALCDRTPPTGNVTITYADGAAIVTATCSDAHGCTETFHWGFAKNETATCLITEATPYDGNATLYEDGRLCWMIHDKNMNNASGSNAVTIPRAAANATLPPKPRHCTNGQLDLPEGESDVDCGGPCDDCALGKGCNAKTDCVSDHCSDGICAANPCMNGVKDAYETDVDCGGPCAACSEGKECAANGDCASRYCENRRCVVISCTDGVKNGYESDVDCGGSCPACGLGRSCAEGKDCSSRYCDGGICTEDPYAEPVDRSPDPDVSPAASSDESRFSLLALLLIVSGLAIMTGSGLWLRLLHQGHEEQMAYHETYLPPPSELTPEQRIALLSQRQAAFAAQQQENRVAEQRAAKETERRAAKETELRSLIEKFEGRPTGQDAADGKPDGKFTAVAEEGRGKKIPAPESDGFVALERLTDATETKRGAGRGKTKRGDEKGDEGPDAFSDLDKLIGEK